LRGDGSSGVDVGLLADRILEMLSSVFERFDVAVQERGLEKIKTIGDAYMVAGGLPEPLPDHAHRVAALAIDISHSFVTTFVTAFHANR
jgi:adenylate cyclase